MKKFILFIAVCFCVSSVFAQSAAQLKNEGNAALKSKDYKTAIEKYEAFLGAEDTVEDNALVFNTGYSASKIKDYAKAEKYFAQSVANNYKLSKSYQYLALMLKKQKKMDEMVATLQKGIEACPTKNSKLVATLTKHYLKGGQVAQKANKMDKAEELYKKASEGKSKYQPDALLGLGMLYFNQGATIMQKANPIANTEPEKFKAESAKAQGFYKKAIAELAKAKALAPAREDITKTMATVKAEIK
ncbi:tetratricopeptide repeat protein [Marinifilum sp. N1E240]|uniref:tetratricopeptide repeat protein n=1 Tax=Marinifilum sp. N1E240 TaxID=2608082 RepID=UPI00128B7174|nr:tetratricopeptide repeat protein [Marinifilum sp. N1E240]MPQ47074.1 tetratricopeptide repeat protein [Marinifilum sp. N1E240]